MPHPHLPPSTPPPIPLPSEIAEVWGISPHPDPSAQASWWLSFPLAFFLGPLGLWHSLRHLPPTQKRLLLFATSSLWLITGALAFGLQRAFPLQQKALALPLFFANLFAIAWILAWKIAPSSLSFALRAFYWIGQGLHLLFLSLWSPLILRILQPSPALWPWLSWLLLALSWIGLWLALPPPPPILPKRPKVALLLAWAFAFGTLLLAWAFWNLGEIAPSSKAL